MKGAVSRQCQTYSAVASDRGHTFYYLKNGMLQKHEAWRKIAATDAENVSIYTTFSHKFDRMVVKLMVDIRVLGLGCVDYCYFSHFSQNCCYSFSLWCLLARLHRLIPLCRKNIKFGTNYRLKDKNSARIFGSALTNSSRNFSD